MFYALILSFLITVFLPLNIFAHGGEGEPFLKIQGKPTIEYSVPAASSPNFTLPQDITAENYLVGQELSFEIDTTALPIPGEKVRLTSFSFDFGDGSQASGLNVTHIYNNPGTYFVILKAATLETSESQLLQSTAINILPKQDSKLPKAVIKVNNQSSTDPLLDILEVNFEKEISFDASSSNSGDSEIIEYIWDLGNGNSKTGKSFKYKYGENPYIVFPVLRVKTKDGFIADSYVQLSDANSKFESGNRNPFSPIFDWKVIAISALAALFITAIILIIFRKFFSAKMR